MHWSIGANDMNEFWSMWFIYKNNWHEEGGEIIHDIWIEKMKKFIKYLNIVNSWNNWLDTLL